LTYNIASLTQHERAVRIKMSIDLWIRRSTDRRYESEYVPINSFSEAERVEKNCIDKNTYSTIRALERNKSFISEVKRIREAFDIPEEGFFEKVDLKSDTDIQREALIELPKRVKIPDILFNSLFQIVKYNRLFLPLPRIFIEENYKLLPSYSNNAVKIIINSELKSQAQLLKFIKKEWPTLEKLMRKMNYKENEEVYISDRDFLIYDLRSEKNLSFGDIAEVFLKDSKEALDELAVKEAFYRVEKKVKSFTKSNAH
jgi:hypothetical protein